MYWTNRNMMYMASTSEWDNGTPIDELVVPEYLVYIAKTLLHIGGNKVIMHLMDTDNYRIAKETLTRYDLPIELKRMRDSDCHNNVLRLWSKGRKTHKVVTGYGLSSDGIWRSHSWVTRNDNTLIETTVTRDIYIGIAYNYYDTKWRHDTYILGKDVWYFG
jgi:hypothetical protein